MIGSEHIKSEVSNQQRQRRRCMPIKKLFSDIVPKNIFSQAAAAAPYFIIAQQLGAFLSKNFEEFFTPSLAKIFPEPFSVARTQSLR